MGHPRNTARFANLFDMASFVSFAKNTHVNTVKIHWASCTNNTLAAPHVLPWRASLNLILDTSMNPVFESARTGIGVKTPSATIAGRVLLAGINVLVTWIICSVKIVNLT
jgi:hypothetical protein|mmetsp:Transcript_1337/g.2395  ORF Transcript_1337/g.2395 Transcript_1337/m.2395 type:complete len:110 (-) Transcript_1337:327-656(-)